MTTAFKTPSGSRSREPVEDAEPLQLASLSRVQCGPWAQSKSDKYSFYLAIGSLYSKPDFSSHFRYSSLSFINARSAVLAPAISQGLWKAVARSVYKSRHRQALSTAPSILWLHPPRPLIHSRCRTGDATQRTFSTFLALSTAAQIHKRYPV